MVMHPAQSTASMGRIRRWVKNIALSPVTRTGGYGVAVRYSLCFLLVLPVGFVGRSGRLVPRLASKSTRASATLTCKIRITEMHDRPREGARQTEQSQTFHRRLSI